MCYRLLELEATPGKFPSKKPQLFDGNRKNETK